MYKYWGITVIIITIAGNSQGKKNSASQCVFLEKTELAKNSKIEVKKTFITQKIEILIFLLYQYKIFLCLVFSQNKNTDKYFEGIDKSPVNPKKWESQNFKL